MTTARRYYRRHRKMPILTGYDAEGLPVLTEPVTVLTMRYYLRKRGGTGWANTYTHACHWYRHKNVAVAFGPDGTPTEWEHALVMIDGVTAYNRHMAQTVERGDVAPIRKLRIEGGRPVEGRGPKGEPYIDATTPADWSADLLGAAK